VYYFTVFSFVFLDQNLQSIWGQWQSCSAGCWYLCFKPMSACKFFIWKSVWFAWKYVTVRKNQRVFNLKCVRGFPTISRDRYHSSVTSVWLFSFSKSCLTDLQRKYAINFYSFSSDALKWLWLNTQYFKSYDKLLHCTLDLISLVILHHSPTRRFQLPQGCRSRYARHVHTLDMYIHYWHAHTLVFVLYRQHCQLTVIR